MNLKTLALDIEEGAAAVESIVLSLVGRVASWVGPLPIAIFTATETRGIFGVSNGVALAASVALELIGVNLANRYVKFTQYNATKNKTAPPVDEKLARRLMWAFYGLDFCVCGLIVGHRLYLGQPITNLIALLYPVAAAASIVSMNQEIQLKRAQAAQEQEQAERKAAREQVKADKINMQGAQEERQIEQVVLPDYSKLDTTEAIKAFYMHNPLATQAQAAEVAGVKRQRVGQVLAQLEQAGQIKRNGNGVEIQ